MSKSELARQYALRFRDDLESGRESKQNLARRMMAENPGVWADLESARRAIRTVTGAGASSTDGTKPAYTFRSTIEHGLKSLQSRKSKTEDFTLDGNLTVGVLSDIHIPYHDHAALESALAYLQDRNPDVLILNGDTIDFYQLSRFCKDPSAVSVAEELRMTREFLGMTREWFKGARILFKVGNHEDRLEKYLWTKCPELLGVEFLSLASLIGADDYGVELVESRQLIKAGKLNILHGHEFGGSFFNPVNPARGMFLRAKCSTLCGHNHQTSEHHENNLNGDALACWSTGCLCDLRPGYLPFAFTKWNHGFAFVTIEQDSFTVHNHRIIDGRVH